MLDISSNDGKTMNMLLSWDEIAYIISILNVELLNSKTSDKDFDEISEEQLLVDIENNSEDEYIEDEEDETVEDDEDDSLDQTLPIENKILRVIRITSEDTILPEEKSDYYIDDLEQVIIICDVYINDISHIENRLIAYYDDENDVYVIDDDTYEYIYRKGYIDCENKEIIFDIHYEDISLDDDFIQSFESDKKENLEAEYNDNDLNMESVLHRIGYNVGAKDGLTDSMRQYILKDALAKGIITKNRTINFLTWLIRQRRKQSNMQNAIAKWQRDIEFLKKL